MAISLTFDTIAEMTAYMAAFGGTYLPASLESFTGGELQPGEILPGNALATGAVSTVDQTESLAGGTEQPKSEASTSTGVAKVVSPEARAAIEAAAAAAEAAQAAKAAKGPKSKPKAKEAAPAPASAPVPAAEVNGKPAEVLDSAAEDKPVENSGEPAATPPTATAETEQPASSSEEAGFFSSTDQTAPVTAAPKVYTVEEVKEALMLLSSKTDQKTFGGLMMQFQVKTFAELATKPEIFTPMMGVVNASLAQLGALSDATAA